MKRLLYLCGVLMGNALGGLTPITGHVDSRWEFQEDAWSHELRFYLTDEVVENPAAVLAADEAFLSLSDKPYDANDRTNSGARFFRPNSTAYDFTGTPANEPIWLAVQGTAGLGEAWPGIDNDQLATDFGSYIPNDPRVSQTTPQPYIRLSLLNYQPPHGKVSHFSMWNTAFLQPPKVWMSTFDTSVDNSFYYGAGGHAHVWWGFTAMGIHRVTLQASAFLGPGATNPTGASAPYTLTFAVGTVANWQATWFNADELDDLAISGLDADPDKDGIVNLIEYAFGTNPRLGGVVPTSEGLGLPTFSLLEEEGIFYQTLTYPRRREGDRLFPEVYEAQFSTSLAGDWSDANVETIASDFAPPLDGLNDEWELVVSRRPVPEGSDRGFGRVSVTAGDDN